MIIGGTPALDLQSAELVKNVQSENTGDQFDLSIDQHNSFHEAYIPAKELGEVQVPTGSLIVPWTVIQEWAIDEIGKKGPQRIQNFKIETTAWRRIEAILCIKLLVKDGTDTSTENSMSQYFSAYQYPGSGDVDMYIENCLKALPGVSPYAFELVYFYRIRLLSDRLIDETPLNRVKAKLKEKYVLSLLDESSLNVLRPNPPNRNIKEKVDSATAVNEAALENQPKGCDQLITDYKEFAKADLLPESHTTWDWHKVKIGCVIFDFYYCTTKFRDQELVASVYWTYPDPLDSYVKKMVENCARESALASVVVLIIFTDITTAIASFKALFWQCLKEKLGQTLSCLDIGLVVNIVPKGKWH